MEKESEHVTFFYQGNRQARFQGAMYSREISVRLADGTELTARRPTAPMLLHNMHTYDEIPEISYTHPGWNLFQHAQVLFNQHVYRYLGVHVPQGWHVNHSLMTVGGKLDVSHHQHHLRDLIQNTSPDTPIVVAGSSRGAATSLVSVAGLGHEEHARIKLVVLEGCFDSLQSVISQFPSWFHPIQRSYLWFLSCWGSYDYIQETPLEACDWFPRHIPVAFITSKADLLIPPILVQRLVRRLRAKGHRNVHYLELEHSPHHNMPDGHPEDRRRYEEFMANIYRGIPELAHLASKTINPE